MILNDSYASVLATVLSIVSQSLKGDVTLGEDTALQADAAMTSLQVMELIAEIEDEFDISFPLNRLPDIRTVKELTQEIVALLDQ